MLLAAFGARVVAQPLARATGWTWLPPFDAWQSGALPYAWLLASQVVLLVLMAVGARQVGLGDGVSSVRLRRSLSAAAAVYGTVMAVRLVLGATWLRGHWWFDHPLPTVFHLVLAAYLWIFAHARPPYGHQS